MEEWKELLQKHNLQEDRQARMSDGDPQDAGTLLKMVQELVGQTDKASETEPEDAAAPVCLPDGYVRRSPVQAYVTPADYRKKTVRRVILIVLGVGFFVLLVIALLRTGLLSFK